MQKSDFDDEVDQVNDIENETQINDIKFRTSLVKMKSIYSIELKQKDIKQAIK